MSPSPSWIAALLQLDRTGADHFTARRPLDANRSGRLFGGLIAAQALAAAGATIDDSTKVPHSLHAYFVRGGRPEVDVHMDVERTRDGRSFDTRRITASQEGKVILDMIASFHAPEPGLDEHPPAPPLPRLEDCDLIGELADAGGRFEMRAPGSTGMFTGPPHWLRVMDAVEDDPLIRACALTYVSDMGLMAAARPPGVSLTRPGDIITAASLDHSVWFHRPYTPHRWHCYDATGINSTSSRGLAVGSLYDDSGVLVASMAQEALWRTR